MKPDNRTSEAEAAVGRGEDTAETASVNDELSVGETWESEADWVGLDDADDEPDDDSEDASGAADIADDELRLRCRSLPSSAGRTSESRPW